MIFYFTGTGNSLYVAKELDENYISIPQVIRQEKICSVMHGILTVQTERSCLVPVLLSMCRTSPAALPLFIQ